MGTETVGSPATWKPSTCVFAPAALKALGALAALLELVAEIAEAPETALPGWSERGRVTCVGASEDLADGALCWAPGGETTASCGDDCADCADGADWGWLLREARAASTAGSPRVPNHSRRAG